MNDVRKIPNAQKEKELKNTKENKLDTQSKEAKKNILQDQSIIAEKPLQWHPAFFAEIQIEFQEEAENLYFENEHQLGTKPKEIDVLIIKKKDKIPIKKNIGRIFRKYNIIEYKGPDDSLTINDFYKVLGYTYFYKADTLVDDEIKSNELTITFVSKRFPQKLFQHLKYDGINIEKIENGIWYFTYNTIPIQFIVTAQLSEKDNFWLRNFTNDLQDTKTIKKLIAQYTEHKNDIYYNSVMDIIVRANKKIFQKEESEMCDALFEILQEHFQDKIEEIFPEKIEEISQNSKAEGIRIGEELGEEKGLHLAKIIFQLNAQGVDYETIASKCMLSVDEVKDILVF